MVISHCHHLQAIRASHTDRASHPPHGFYPIADYILTWACLFLHTWCSAYSIHAPTPITLTLKQVFPTQNWVVTSKAKFTVWIFIQASLTTGLDSFDCPQNIYSIYCIPLSTQTLPCCVISLSAQLFFPPTV